MIMRHEAPPVAVQNGAEVTAKPRNPVARSPLLRKGGAHRKSRSAERMKSRQALREDADDSGRTPRDDGAGQDPVR